MAREAVIRTKLATENISQYKDLQYMKISLTS